MPGEDQERFEDYLELERYIEELQAGRVAHPPADLTPGQARIYRMAALFRSASPHADEIRPEFAANLQADLEQELQEGQPTVRLPLLRKKSSQAEKPELRKSPRVSRRALLAGGAAAAAAFTVGAGIEHMIEQPNRNSGTVSKQTPYPENIIGNSAKTTWHFVTALTALSDRPVRFATETLVGYVVRDDGDNNDPQKGQILAMSAACTHMGCIVQWQDSDQKFHCPCHDGQFTAYGKVDTGVSAVRYLTPLPRLRTKVENGNVYVEVPISQSSK